MSSPNWRIDAHDRVLVLGDQPEPSLSASKSTSSPSQVSIGISFGHAGVVERARPEARGLRAEHAARAASRAGGGARARLAAVAKRSSSASCGDVEHAAQRRPLGVLDRRDQDPVVVLGLVEAVERGEARADRWSRRGRCHGFAVDEEHVGREDRAAVEQRRPQLLALAGALAGGTARRARRRPRASRSTRRTSRSGSRAARCPRASAPASYSRPAAAWYSGSRPPNFPSGPRARTPPAPPARRRPARACRFPPAAATRTTGSPAAGPARCGRRARSCGCRPRCCGSAGPPTTTSSSPTSACPAITPSCAGPARRVRDRRPGQPQRHVRQRPAGLRRAGDRAGHHRHRPGHVPAGRRRTPGVHRHRRHLAAGPGPDRHAARRQGHPRRRQLPARRAVPAGGDRPQRRGQVHPARRADRHAARHLRRRSPTTSRDLYAQLRRAAAPDRPGAAGEHPAHPAVRPPGPGVRRGAAVPPRRQQGRAGAPDRRGARGAVA